MICTKRFSTCYLAARADGEPSSAEAHRHRESCWATCTFESDEEWRLPYLRAVIATLISRCQQLGKAAFNETALRSWLLSSCLRLFGAALQQLLNVVMGTFTSQCRLPAVHLAKSLTVSCPLCLFSVFLIARLLSDCHRHASSERTGGWRVRHTACVSFQNLSTSGSGRGRVRWLADNQTGLCVDTWRTS